MESTSTILKAFQQGMDGAHCGLSDWYPDKEKALDKAINARKPFDTGWYSSKKEIASARIIGDGNTISVEVSVSDDFDTEGHGGASAKYDLESVREAIESAWNDADGDLKDNADYAGYSLIHWSTAIPQWRKAENAYPIETRKRYGRKQAQCLDYYLVNLGEHDQPPGDNYYHWGWQQQPDDVTDDSPDIGNKIDPSFGVPAHTVAKFEDFALSLKAGSLRIGDWEIKAWEGE